MSYKTSPCKISDELSYLGSTSTTLRYIQAIQAYAEKGGYSEDLDLCALGLHQRHLSAWKWHMIHLDEACLCSANAIFNGYDMRGMKDCKKIESSLFQLLDAMACKWSYETEYDPI